MNTAMCILKLPFKILTKSNQQGAATQIYAALHPDGKFSMPAPNSKMCVPDLLFDLPVKEGGQYFAHCNSTRPSALSSKARDPKYRQQLWEMSAQHVEQVLGGSMPAAVSSAFASKDKVVPVSDGMDRA
jgi:hypothetical protein